MYTIFTRPTKGIFFVGDPKDLEKAIKNPEKKKRSDLGKKLDRIPKPVFKSNKRKRE
jgi:hypothetical protein